MNAKRTFRLSNQAEEDYWQIFLWGCRQFGERQAEIYHENLLSEFRLICENPAMFPAATNIHPELEVRRCVSNAHVIYFEERDNGLIVIVRILSRQDPLRSLAGQFE